MSSRQMLNIGMGSAAILLAVSVGAVFSSLGDREADQARIDLAGSQQVLIQEIAAEVEALSTASNLMDVGKARENLGASILQFDRNLNALLHGGQIADAAGNPLEIPVPSSDATRTVLAETAELWVQTGLPLADMAAGEFSIFSSAGQAAAAGLRDNGSELMTRLGDASTAIAATAKSRATRAQAARWISLGLTAAFLGMGLIRLQPSRKKAVETPAAPVAASSKTEEPPSAPLASSASSAASPTSPPTGRIWNRPAGQTFTSPVDFDNVNASVDQLSVDMNTIASSTDKMQIAIDSVGHAMQGMLFSLNQMAQDTAEGYKIVRGANNAATYTGGAASELAESALEMSRVVGRVTQLAVKTKQVAAQIEAEAVSTGSPGEAFTSVVAGEVQGLARQTGQATAQIEQTVAEILGTARQYEEAIGQILKNIGAINKVSENLGEMMLHPPAAGVAGTPLPGAQAVPLAPQPQVQAPPAPAAELAPESPAPEPPAPESPVPESPAPESPVPPEPTAEETADAIEDTGSNMSAESNANVFMLGGPKKKASPKPEPIPESQPEPPAPAATSESGATVPEPEEEDSGSNIFMLNKPKKTAAPKAEEPAPAPEAKTEEPVTVPADKPEGSGKGGDGGSDGNIFMLNKPKK